MVFELVEKGTRHTHWMGQAFLVLGDVYIAKKDNFQAIHTLKSIIDNYDNKTDGVIDAARDRLAKAEAMAAEENRQKASDIEIDLNK